MLFRLIHSRFLMACGVAFIALFSSGFIGANQIGAMICSDQFVGPYEGQYLILESGSFQTIQSLPSDRDDDPIAVHALDVDSPPTHRFSEQQLMAPSYCWAVNIKRLAMYFPELENSILEYQAMPASDLSQGYRIISIPAVAHNDGLRARAHPALIAGLIAYVLFTWTAPSWAAVSALVIGGICFSKPVFCHYLFAGVQTTVSSFFANSGTQEQRLFSGGGKALGTENQGGSSTTIYAGNSGESDSHNAAKLRKSFTAFSGLGQPLNE